MKYIKAKDLNKGFAIGDLYGKLKGSVKSLAELFNVSESYIRKVIKVCKI